MLDLTTLNPQQRDAVEHFHGPALVLAGAGSGKTRVITFRIARLIERGVAPDHILGVTFTNKAAREMRERVTHLLGAQRARRVVLSTFHALGARMLREEIGNLGWSSPFTILDESDRFRVMKEILREANLGGTSANEARLLGLISRAKNAMTSPAGLPEARFNPLTPRAERFYEAYQMALRNLNAVDFDDLLLLPTRLMIEFPEVRDRFRDRHRFVMVDEYQDTNPLQLRFLQELCGQDRPNLLVVGDDDQSIYAFRGAVSDYILRFAEFFPGTHVVALEQNYRSTGTILNAANAVVAHNSKRHRKTLWSTLGDGSPIQAVRTETDFDETDYIARRILAQSASQQRPFHEFAILYRSNPQARGLEESLRQHRVPYRIVGGTSLFDRKEVKDAAAYLQLVLNPWDELALRRVLNYPARGIGTRTFAWLTDQARDREQRLIDVLRRVHAEETPEVPPRALDGIASFLGLVDRWRDALRATSIDRLQETVSAYIEEAGLPSAIRSGEKNANVARVRVQILEEWIGGLGRAVGPKAWDALDEFVAQASLDPVSSDSEKDTEHRVTLMTLHASKGLEFPVVFLCGVNDGILPHERALEEPGGVQEERRLFYVGMTRAQQELIVTYARSTIRRNQRELLKPSRFLREIPRELVRLYQGGAAEGSPPRPGTGSPGVPGRSPPTPATATATADRFAEMLAALAKDDPTPKR